MIQITEGALEMTSEPLHQLPDKTKCYQPSSTMVEFDLKTSNCQKAPLPGGLPTLDPTLYVQLLPQRFHPF